VLLWIGLSIALLLGMQAVGLNSAAGVFAAINTPLGGAAVAPAVRVLAIGLAFFRASPQRSDRSGRIDFLLRAGCSSGSSDQLPVAESLHSTEIVIDDAAAADDQPWMTASMIFSVGPVDLHAILEIP
jgi:hypothetical protein